MLVINRVLIFSESKCHHWHHFVVLELMRVNFSSPTFLVSGLWNWSKSLVLEMECGDVWKMGHSCETQYWQENMPVGYSFSTGGGCSFWQPFSIWRSRGWGYSPKRGGFWYSWNPLQFHKMLKFFGDFELSLNFRRFGVRTHSNSFEANFPRPNISAQLGTKTAKPAINSLYYG